MPSSVETAAVNKNRLTIDHLSLISGLPKEARAFTDPTEVAEVKDDEALTINSLPDEVIVEVFWRLTLIAPIKSRGRSRGWIVVTQVCHRWRAIAIASPQLWCSIDWFYNIWADKCLERCKTVPLCITCSRPNISELKELHGHRILTGNLKRTRVLSMAVSIGIITRIMEKLFLRAPMLEILDLNALSVFGTVSDSAPVRLLGEHAPALRILRLNRVILNVPGSICRNLRHLSFSNQHSHLTRPSLETFLLILQHSPRLVTLKLDQGGPYIDLGRSPQQKYGTIELSHLQLVSIRGTKVASSHILAHLSAPACNYADITIYNDSQFHDLYSILPHDGVFWKSWAVAGPIRTMHFNGHMSGGADVHFVFPPVSGSAFPARKLRIRLEPQAGLLPAESQSAVVNALSHISRLFPLTHATAFHLSACGLISSRVSKETWEDLLSFMPALTRLEVTRTRPVSLLLALQADIPAKPQSMLCPLLCFLKLKDADHSKYIWEIIDCMKWRASKNAKVDVFIYEKGKLCCEGDLIEI